MHFHGGADRTAGLTDSGQRGCEVRGGKQDEAEVSNRKAQAAGEPVWSRWGVGRCPDRRRLVDLQGSWQGAACEPGPECEAPAVVCVQWGPSGLPSPLGYSLTVGCDYCRLLA